MKTTTVSTAVKLMITVVLMMVMTRRKTDDV